jgi:hypothetical protein
VLADDVPRRHLQPVALRWDLPLNLPVFAVVLINH